MSLKENRSWLAFLISLGFKAQSRTQNEFLYKFQDRVHQLTWLYSPLTQKLIAAPADKLRKQHHSFFFERHAYKKTVDQLKSRAFKQYTDWSWEFFSLHHQTTEAIYMEFYEPLCHPGKTPSKLNVRKDDAQLIANLEPYRQQFPRAYFFSAPLTPKSKNKGVPHVQ